MIHGGQQRRAYAAWPAVCLFWGTTYLAIRICLETMPPMTMAGARHVTASAILAFWLLSRGVPLPGRASWPGHALLGTLMLGVGNGAVVWAEQWVPSGMTAVMVAGTPFWMVGLEALLPTGDRLRARHVAGLTLGFAGILMLAWSDLRPEGLAGRSFLNGVIALQVACLGWTLGSAYSRRHARHENALAGAAMQMLIGGSVLLLAGWALGEWGGVRVNTRTLAAFLYLIVFGSVVGYASYVYALRYLPVATVSLYAYVNPVIAIVLGAVLLAEPITTRMAIAIAIIFAGMLVVRPGEGLTRLRAMAGGRSTPPG